MSRDSPLVVDWGQVELRHRLCRRCGAEFWICRSCDRGHRYCSGTCSGQARAESLRRARRKHRHSDEGRADHRDEEQQRRKRIKDRQIPGGVGDQSSQAKDFAANPVSMNPQLKQFFYSSLEFCVICKRHEEAESCRFGTSLALAEWGFKTEEERLAARKKWQGR